MATGDIWRLAMQGSWNAQQYVNIWHIRFKSEAATPAGATAHILTNFYDLFKTADVSSSWGLSIVHGRKLAVPALLYEAAITSFGANAGDMMPTQCAMVCTLRTGIAGRSRRGRLYLGGFLETAHADSAWSLVRTNAIQQYFDDLVAAIGSGGSNPDYEWGVWSRTLGGEDPGPYDLVAGFRPITEVVCRRTVYTQRRRTVGVGA